jgi:tripartite-type tricarboxylate transporter receptor subunit TctC
MTAIARYRLVEVLVAFAAWSGACGAHGAFPEKPLRLVVPFAPGGGADAIARAMAQGLSRSLGQPVLVEPKPGADATLAGAHVAHAPPDGYTLLFASNTGFSGAPFLHKDIGYDPVRDFTPISMLGFFPYFLVTSREFPPRTLRELVEYARSHPGQVSYASGNAMGIIATAQLAAAAKLDMVHVPYKGEAPALPDLLGNRVQFILTTGFIIPHVKEGKVRAIAAMLDQRSEALPDVPTVVEGGFPALGMRGWAAIVAPAGLPQDIQARLNAAVRESLEMESTRAALASQGFPGRASTPQELGQFIRTQLDSWRAAVRAAGLRPE